MKLYKIFIPIFTVVFITISYISPLVAVSESISDKVLRLHILANSDSEEDQELKLQVRDYILESCDIFNDCKNINDALKTANENISTLQNMAEECIRNNGYYYDVDVTVGKEYFDTREYDNITLPAGNYHSLIIKIGEAKGKNWWCVMFPSVCLSAYTDEDLSNFLDEEEIKLIENKDGYAIRFKTVEIYEKIKDKFQ